MRPGDRAGEVTSSTATGGVDGRSARPIFYNAFSLKRAIGETALSHAETCPCVVCLAASGERAFFQLMRMIERA